MSDLAKLPVDADAVRAAVRQGYSRAAEGGQGCCGGAASSHDSHAKGIGYSTADLAVAPQSANLGLGCGNPTALAALAPGEVVVDLGAGAGLDAFIAAEAVGPDGRVIGVDMTPAMLESARRAAVETGVHDRVEFREGIIEQLPVASDSADVIISNCVINLSPDKPAVFAEAFRVLKPGGRLAVSDIVLTAPLPDEVHGLAEAYTGCVSGAMLADDYLQGLRDAGFVDVRYTRTPGGCLFDSGDPIAQEAIAALGEQRAAAVAQSIWSYKIEARKP